MNELKVFKTNLKINDKFDEDFYDVQLDDNGHITEICLYDQDYVQFEFDGNLLQAISLFSHIKKLDIAVSDYTITDLSGLSNLKNLEHLTFEDCCKVDDISALADLKQLTHLSINNAGIKDITPLKGLNKLSDLCLAGNEITSVDILKEHTKLINLNLSYNKITEVSALLQCKEIKAFSVEYNQINDLTVVAGFLQIEHLSFHNNNITDLGFLESLSSLKSLSFHNNQVNDITPLTRLINLQNLYMQGISVANLEAIKHATKLNYLNAGPVENFDGEIVSQFTALNMLHLQHCKICDITFLKPLKKLTNLNLNHNQISDINTLYECKSLSYIHLRDNVITQPFLADSFSRLAYVDLRENEFGNKIFVSYNRNPKEEDQELLTDLNQKVADHYLNLGEKEKSLAFFYLNTISKTTLKIRFEELLATSPSDVYYFKYYIVSCVNCLSYLLIGDKNLIADDTEIQVIYNRVKEIITQTTFIDKIALLESLNHHKLYHKYNANAEYIKYLSENYLMPKKEHFEMLYKAGKSILKKETISEVLYIYKELVTFESPFQYPLYKEISKFLNSNFSSLENISQNRFKDILENILESKLPHFDIIEYYQRNHSQNVRPVYQGRSVSSIDYPETGTSPWRIILLIALIIKFLFLLKACTS
ncbi:internalin A [Mucilaginibacter sp. UYP25]|uniref:leucine-rich repeat domain-containing protein n=1 Tax=unclassified Mucilaginibacter TaxID=2617802 RepID=UPI003394450D